jgi:hypothetical protein
MRWLRLLSCSLIMESYNATFVCHGASRARYTFSSSAVVDDDELLDFLVPPLTLLDRADDGRALLVVVVVVDDEEAPAGVDEDDAVSADTGDGDGEVT